jgi:mRNA interferase HicA
MPTEGGNHTKVIIGNRTEMVPRHSEINEMTAKAIIRQKTTARAPYDGQ